MMRFLFAIIIQLLFVFKILADGYQERVFIDSIKTVQLHRTDWDLSAPILTLNTTDKLILQFDELSVNVKRYNYTIEHCTSDWVKSDIDFTDYADGYQESTIHEYKYSRSTTVPYIHYQVSIPNDELKIKLSGNYIVKVYQDNDPNKVVIIKKFYVVQPLSTIDIVINRPTEGKMYNTGQQVDFKINHQIENIVDATREFRVIISQNFRFDNAVYDIQPVYMEGKTMDYTMGQGNILLAGNEFRNFDIKNIKQNSQYIHSVRIEDMNYHVYLNPSLVRTFDRYSSDVDLNGRYKIVLEDATDNNTEADYVYVHFSLPMDVPDVDGDLYVMGELTDWQCKKDFKMTYNFDKKAYELKALLKQGYYNYEIDYLPKKSKTPDPSFIEGNHWETENDYYILLYYRPFSGRYEQLICIANANSMGKQQK